MALAALRSLFWAHTGAGGVPEEGRRRSLAAQSTTLGLGWDSRQPSLPRLFSVLGHLPACLSTVPSGLASPLHSHLHASLALLSAGSSLEASSRQQQGWLRIALASRFGRKLAIREPVEFLITCQSFCQAQAPASRGAGCREQWLQQEAVSA